MKLVVLTWDDAQGAGGWMARADVTHEPDRITSAGWLIKRDDAGITICQSFNTDDRIADTLFVPNEYLRDVRTLEDVTSEESA